ncbi:cyclin-D3-2-like isoform X1 [Canna indica]|uniref:Cyclin-D3-2-like isoform X1 n=1 Tax=Canna indica TaxID=4628 RepID=A0AAQ3JSA6_9LILI|nr:cyclin-D3-2-like isoform X1 [Canna indica]
MALLSFFDHLYCQEESLELEDGEDAPAELLLPLLEDRETERHVLEAVAEEEWAEVLSSLAAKEGEALPLFVPDGGGGDSYLSSTRKEQVDWVARAAAIHGFSALTELLAVSYFDRCFLAYAGAGRGLLRLHDDKPWMGRLAAVACLSLAAKVEETHVPILLDLQVPAPAAEGGGFVFEAKTVRRMELLVLSVLGWRMNLVTPLSFVHHLLPRICSQNKAPNSSAPGIAARIRESARSCETALLSVIADWRWIQYSASVWAAAALLQATGSDGGGVDSQEIRHLISLLNAPKEKLEQCQQLIAESVSTSAAIVSYKRKHSSAFRHCSSPPSPSGVIGSCFSCESSCDSWPMWPSSVSSSPEVPPPSKRLNGAVNKRFGDDGAS